MPKCGNEKGNPTKFPCGVLVCDEDTIFSQVTVAGQSWTGSCYAVVPRAVNAPVSGSEPEFQVTGIAAEGLNSDFEEKLDVMIRRE